MWFTLLSLQLGLLETISETQGRLTGAAERPGQRKTSWSPSGSGSPAEIWENDKSLINFKPHFYSLALFQKSHSPGWNVMLRWSWTHSFFSLSKAEKGPFMSSMVQEISLFWRSLYEETKTDRIVKNPHPYNNCTCYVNKTLCGFTFRVRGKMFATLKLYSKRLHALQEVPSWPLRHF